ncbi:hypothetical protein CH299_24800 [Rhodococcus sp. 14-2686-1-2]|nr:hypothetical protein CH301_24280 [Rhodococcus sp. 15-1189-1-1a]OZF09616.1 hypothetical protein CH299_24800 [Rhodococcus sp. 14-2686-1-2]
MYGLLRVAADALLPGVVRLLGVLLLRVLILRCALLWIRSAAPGVARTAAVVVVQHLPLAGIYLCVVAWTGPFSDGGPRRRQNNTASDRRIRYRAV